MTDTQMSSGLPTIIDAERVAGVRRFTRFYTTVFEVLEEGLLDTPYSVTEAHVIFELAQRDATDMADLRRDLRIDPGYLSRIVARFEADGLVSRHRSDIDLRRQVLALTARGHEVYSTLDGRSSAQVAQLLADIPDADQRRLIASMETIRAILGDDDRRIPRAVVLRSPEPGDYGWIVARHGALYAAEYGWDETFEGLVAQIVADYVAAQNPTRERAWIAEVDGERVGCVFCVAKDEQTAQLRILLVEPTARGLGIGSRLVDECLRFATHAGYTTVTLWTNDVLVAARRIYEAAGFTLVDEEPHHSFGHDLVGQHWSRDL
ncbi:MAG TPA: bifunctional helix-turn-helix transcriptional regulator/GNAT family N-acetyltransferase [Euzebyales bacterium]|nr:bifunctional helix-turn-helix transcriptional regulator/GNAT family N-acetyltransferase [Euzebyales bacterium]